MKKRKRGKKMKTLVAYSTITGNTKKVCEWAYEAIKGEKNIVNIKDSSSICLKDYDRIIFGFWVNKGTADGAARKFLKQISGKEILYLGTLGAYPDSEHANKVRSRVQKLCEEKNTFLAGLLIQGKVAEKLVEAMYKFPLKLIHPMTKEREERIKVAALHPNEEDKKLVEEFIDSIYQS